MVCVLSAVVGVIFWCLLGVSVAYPAASARTIRIMPPDDSLQLLEKLFTGSRMKDQDVNSTSTMISICRPRAFDQALKIDDTCLSCTTNINTGAVSECPPGCCRNISFSEDMETAHFITCLKGCCIRSIGVLAPDSDRDAGILSYESAFLVKNDITLNEVSPLSQCETKNGPSKKCGSTCAVFTSKGTKCSSASSFQIPGIGENFVDPVCPGVDDIAKEITKPGRSDPSSAGRPSDGNGSAGDEDTDESSPPEEDEISEGEGSSTGTAPPPDETSEGDDSGKGSGSAGDGADLDEDDEMKGELEASPTEETTEETTEEGTEAGNGDEDDEPLCFPAEATVKLENGYLKRMDHLESGDVVLVGAGKYSKVFGFTHQAKEYKGRFVELRTSSGHVIRLTAGHFMYADGKLHRAKDVRVGKTVKLFDGSASKVVEVGEWLGTGLFNPQTLHGDIVVDGVVVSTYTDAVEAGMAHALLVPVRAVCRWVDTSSALMKLARVGRRVFAFVGVMWC